MKSEVIWSVKSYMLCVDEHCKRMKMLFFSHIYTKKIPHQQMMESYSLATVIQISNQFQNYEQKCERNTGLWSTEFDSWTNVLNKSNWNSIFNMSNTFHDSIIRISNVSNYIHYRILFFLNKAIKIFYKSLAPFIMRTHVMVTEIRWI